MHDPNAEEKFAEFIAAAIRNVLLGQHVLRVRLHENGRKVARGPCEAGYRRRAVAPGGRLPDATRPLAPRRGLYPLRGLRFGPRRG
jgi:hypothetical protein